MSYIHNSEFHTRCLLADICYPKPVYTDEMNCLMDAIEPLEDEFDMYRRIYKKPMDDYLRDLLYNRIIPLRVKWRKLFEENNQEYIRYWDTEIPWNELKLRNHND